MDITLLIRLAIASAAAGTVFFAFTAVRAMTLRQRATRSELAHAAIIEAEKRRGRVPLKARFTYAAATRGYTGSMAPLAVAWAFLYLIATLIMTAVGVPSLAALGFAIPFTTGVVWIVSSAMAAKRKRKFDRQLLTALEMASAQIATGMTPLQALQQSANNIPDPLRSEFQRTLSAARVTNSAVVEFQKLSLRYPSRAFSLFLAALEISEVMGGAIGPALNQAAETLQKDFDLASEATAEISQARYEFWGIVAMMGFIGFSVFSAGDAETRTAYTSVVGIIVMCIGLANFGVGIFRAMGMFRKAEARPSPSLRNLLNRDTNQIKRELA